MNQPRRGLADTALSLGTDISARIQRLYAPPAAWSHGYLWGADVVTVPDGATFSPQTDEIPGPTGSRGGVEPGTAPTAYTLEIDSPTAVRALNGAGRRGREGGVRDSRRRAAEPAGSAAVRHRQGHQAGARGCRRATPA